MGICVIFRFFGIYPFKRIGNSELMPTSRCKFWLTYILSLSIVLGLLLLILVLVLNEISFECWIVTETIMANETHLTKIEYLIYAVQCLIIIFMHLYCIFKWKNFAKELSIIQKDFNCIDMLYPDHGNKVFIISSYKIPIYCQQRSKRVIMFFCIIPSILFIIATISWQVGNANIWFYHFSTTNCQWNGHFLQINDYLIIQNIISLIILLILVIPTIFYFYVVYVDISHIFISWSESIKKAQGMERLTLLLQSMSFIRILNHFKKIISPILFCNTVSIFIMAILEGYQTLANGLNNLVVSELLDLMEGKMNRILTICALSILIFQIDDLIDSNIKWRMLMAIGTFFYWISLISILAINCCLSEQVANQTNCVKKKIIMGASSNKNPVQDDSNYICTLLDEFKGFTGKGFFTLNHSMLTAMTASFFTFMVILIQFKQSENQE